MKYKLLLLSLVAATTGALAQDHHHSADYDVSVYDIFKDLPMSGRVDWVSNKKKVNAQFPKWYVFSDKLTGNFRDITGEAIALPGNNLEAKLSYCFNNQLKALGIDRQQWIQTQNTDAGFATFFNYKQQIDGHDVVFSRLSFRFSKDGKLVRIKHKSFGDPTHQAPSVSMASALSAAKSGLEGVKIDQAAIDENWVWFPVPGRSGYELKPSWAFTIYGHDHYLPVELSGYVDGITGEILYRSNGVHETVDLTVTGTVFKQNPLMPMSIEPLAEMKIRIGADSFYTDPAGYFSDPALSTPINATLALEGRWSKVNNQLAAGMTPGYNHAISATGTSTVFDTSAVNNFNERLVNAYYHVTRVHDFMKGYLPSFIGMDFPLNTNVDLTSGTCNAFYIGAAGSSINFYAAAGNCNSMAYCGDIIYHEYGHGINHKYYQAHGAISMDNGALNEAYADIWGIGITKDPVLGKGAFAGGNVIRRYDQAPKVYPYDIVGEVHADGEIIAGAWWDVAQNIASVDTMVQLFTGTYPDLVDGPDGTEGEVYHDALISALVRDDDDANLTNGTPHFTQIVSAFARHGIYLLLDAEVVHEDISNQQANQPVALNVSVTVTEPVFFQGIKVFFKERSATAWDSLAMTTTGGNNYTATLPGFADGSIVDYYFAVYDVFATANKYGPVNFTPTIPSTSNNIIYQFGVGLTKVLGEDFEAAIDSAWQIGLPADDATASGRWIVASPIPSFASGGLPVQPGVDHTTNSASGKCLVTGNAASGQADVDNGVTSVVTPVYDLTGFTDPVIEFFRWYGNDRGSNRGNDYWEVFVKDLASSIWFNRVDYTNKSDYSWRRRIFSVKQYYPNSLPAGIQLKFVASDKIVTNASFNGQSTVEAAVDDLFIYDKASATGVKDVNAVKATIYPNPANDEIHIEFKERYKGVISLNDITGKEVAKMEMKGDKSSCVLSTATLANGTYMLVIHLGSSIQTTKVNVMH